MKSSAIDRMVQISPQQTALKFTKSPFREGVRSASVNTSLSVFVPVAIGMNDHKDTRVGCFPEVITLLPEADIQIKGIKAWLLQGENHQLVFFEMEPSAQVPEHSHDYAQWGIMIKGKMELVIEGKPRICEKGDEYVIPAKAKHHAKFLEKSRVIDFFSEKSRYKPKSAR